ncbi:MAG: heavy metal transporter [Sporocytophaga sp.]|uniref:heavy metal transporter n=1 Tax=Sporocytophaga sp. TaxID=2231183 RepID=UPI001AFE3141|nr:heavy metal transporter [Sporocytophaga sp.]MBO9700373.1 heavy metal transporter [Sporocytophaga sp.]
MRKLIRPTYPKEFSIGFLLLIFIFSTFLSHQIFDVPFLEIRNSNVYPGMILVGVAVIIMVLIIWEEFLFPIKIKEVNNEIVFRNRRNKLKTQVFIYLFIPAIFGFIYFEYEINHIRFFLWAAVCIIAPVVEKLASGINNYNDFLKLANDSIEFRNNKKVGLIKLKDVLNFNLVKDDHGVIKKIQLLKLNNEEVIIDLDEMELEAFYDTINSYIASHYQHMLSKTAVSSVS